MNNITVSERLREGGLYTVALLAALVARLTSMDEGFWIDEVMSAQTIADSWGLMFTRVGFTDVHPPGYYALLKLWAVLVGEGDTPLRLLSLIAGLATVALVVRWSRGHTGRLAALFSGLALACSLFHVHYSVEVRSYALFTLVALALAWRVERWVSGPWSRTLRWIVLLEVVALSLHYYALLWVALLNLFVFTHAHLGDRALRLRWLRGQLGAFAVFTAWLPLLLVQMFELPEVMKLHLSDDLPMARIAAALGPLPSIDPSPLAVVLGALVVALAFAGAWLLHTRPSPPPSEEEPAAAGAFSLPVVVLLMTTLLFAPLIPLMGMPMSDALVAAYMRQLPWTYALITGVVALGAVAILAGRLRLTVALPTLLALGGPLLVLGLNQLQPMLFLRNLLVFVPPVLLLGAVAVDRAPRPVQVLACLALLGLAWPHVGAGSPSFMPRQDFESAAAALADVPEVPVVVAPGWDTLGLARYGPKGRVLPAMTAAEVRQAVGNASSFVILLSRPGRLPLSAEAVQAALDGTWKVGEPKLYRGHRGAMQWLRYTRVDGG